MATTTQRTLWVSVLLLCGSCTGQAATRYVWPGSPSDGPGTTWTNAFHTIQAAVNTAIKDDTVLVTNGTYLLASSLSVTSGITLRSVNGQEATTISGGGAVQCFTLTHSNASVEGFTITAGLAQNGGGIYMPAGTVRFCRIAGCSVVDPTFGFYSYGGGLYLNGGGTVLNCSISGNSASGNDAVGGGLYLNGGGTVLNCSISGNGVGGSFAKGGGVFLKNSGLVLNCTIRGNAVNGAFPCGGGVSFDGGGTVRNCEISGNWAAGPAHATAGGVYMWSGAVLNCTIVNNSAVTDDGPSGNAGGVYCQAGGTLENTIIYFNVPDNCGLDSRYAAPSVSHCCTIPSFVVPCSTADPMFVDAGTGNYRLGAGSPCINAGTNQPWMVNATDLDGEPRMTGIVDIGAYEDIPTTHYVSHAGAHVWPYATWNDAATNLQAAVDAARPNHWVLVAGGTYPLASAVVVTNAVTIRGVDGAAATVVDGGGVTRCFVLTHTNAVLEDMTIAHGTADNDSVPASRGGGVYAASGAALSGCLIASNTAASSSEGSANAYGGGVCFDQGGTLERCTLVANRALAHCVENPMMPPGMGGTATARGGGLYAPDGSLSNCIMIANQASADATFMMGGMGQAVAEGGGVWTATGLLRNSLLTSNRVDTTAMGIAGSTANSRGGGARVNGAQIENCTVVTNRVTFSSNWGAGSDGAGGGIYGPANVLNGIVYFNTAATGPNCTGGGAFTNCCTLPLPGGGSGNSTNNPGFVAASAGDWRLAIGSPCFNTGTNQPWMAGAIELDSRPRILFGSVDRGAYEYQPNVTYASLVGSHSAPYDTWARAATNIQAAVDAVASAGTVWVTNGVYATCGRTAPGCILTNRVCVTNAIMLRSVGGADVTIVRGAADAGTAGCGSNAVRCLYVSANAIVDGFTLEGGYTASIPSSEERYGGGALLCTPGPSPTACCAPTTRLVPVVAPTCPTVANWRTASCPAIPPTRAAAPCA